MKGLSVTDNMRRDEKKCKAEIRYPRESDEEDLQFWTILGGKPATINPPTPDDVVEGSEDQDHQYNFYHITNESGTLECKNVEERPLKKDMLSTKDTYILELHK